MNILVACEESQRVCKAFRDKGHRAFSCDIQQCSGGHPEWHIQGDVIPLLNGNCEFTTADTHTHTHTQVGEWDMIIAFPPCTDLAVSGARHFEKKRLNGSQRASIEFFCKFLEAKCDKVMIENPVNIISGEYVKEHFPDLCEKYNLPIKPTQHIQPFWFGEPIRKKTCYWLKGLPKLKPTNVVEPEIIEYTRKDGRKTTFSKAHCIGLGKDRSKTRSKTAIGIAQAIADQWG